jgi:hypothetical protein
MDEHTNRHTQFVRWSPNKQCQTHDLSPPIAAHVDLIVTRSNFNHVTLCDSDVWEMSLEHSHAGTNLRLVRRLKGVANSSSRNTHCDITGKHCTLLILISSDTLHQSRDTLRHEQTYQVHTHSHNLQRTQFHK